MIPDPVVASSTSRPSRSSRRSRWYVALASAIAAAVVVTSVPAQSATKKKATKTKAPTAMAASKDLEGQSAGFAKFSLPSSVGLVDDVTGGAAIVRKGSLASLATATVSVGGTRTVTIGALANESLADARVVHNQVLSARAGLFADPLLTEDVSETADATILTSTSAFTVVDRNAVATKVPSIGAFQSKGVSLNSLTPSQRDAFDRYKRTLDAKPNGHPLKDAATKGDAALFDALKAGQADITMTTTVRVEKNATPASGKYAKLSGLPTLNASVAGSETSGVATNAPGTAVGTPNGEANHTAKFLTGWSKGDALHWSERIDIGIAWVEVGAHAGYTVGLRVPVEMKGTMTPAKIDRKGSGSFNDSYEVKVYDVAAIDGDEQHYKGTGLDKDLRASGKEFALEADLYVFAKGEVLGAKFNERFPKKPLLDEGMHMRPPYGDCGVECGLNFFFPANLTKTGFDVAGIISGGGQLGFNVGGSGVVSYDYESLVNDAVVSSTRVSTGEAAKKHRVSTDGRTGVTNRFTTVLPGKSTFAIPFGYRLSNPGYDWNIAITPVVKVTGVFDYVIGKFDLLLGPIALPVSIELGTLKLPRHEGTQDVANKVDGSVRTDLRVAGDRIDGVEAVADTRALVNPGAATTTAAPNRRRKKKKGATTTVVGKVPDGAPAATLVPVVGVSTKNTKKVKNTRKKNAGPKRVAA